MGTILLKLSGPLQSWGSDSRFTERKTEHQPTKSGVIGLLAASLGRRRGDEIGDLSDLFYGVRIDQPGCLECDFQTAHKMYRDSESGNLATDSNKSMPLSRRYYLSDAVFVAGFEAEDEALTKYASALLHPRFPLFLGRRSCPPSDKVLMGVYFDKTLMDAFKDTPLQASDWYCKRHGATITLEVMRDALEKDASSAHLVRDVPCSFSQIKRDYLWRNVVRDTVTVDNPKGNEANIHDPWAALGEV